MPELPEVETVRQGLRPVLEGRRIVEVLVRRHDLRIPVPADFVARLTGRRVERIARRAKYLLVHCEGGLVLLIHLGMSGRLTFFNGAASGRLGRYIHGLDQAEGDAAGCDEGMGPHDHIRLVTEDGTRIVFSDHRRFGLMTLAEECALAGHPLLRDLGPEPLGAGFSPAVLAEKLAGRSAPLKSVLLDQRVIAGLGNIYVCEALFRAGLSPKRRAHTVSGAGVARLAAAIGDVLEDALRAGGSSLRDYTQTDGTPGFFQHEFRVYGRTGQPCSKPGCGATIRRTVQGNRSSFHCPRCQR